MASLDRWQQDEPPMRMVPARYSQPKEIKVKAGQVSQIRHVSVPLKGLSLDVKLTERDPLLAPVLTNWTVEGDRIRSRSGYAKMSQTVAKAPIERLVPWYGSAGGTVISATNNTLCKVTDGSIFKSGFTSNDWAWTSFSNLGDVDFTIMVNGTDGVWSWDGGFSPDPLASSATLANTNPCKVTVAAGEIGKYINGRVVNVTGATGPQWTPANGAHMIQNVNSSAFTFELVGVNTTGGQTSATGIFVQTTGSLAKMPITAPTASPWCNPNQFSTVITHQNRLFFADNAHLAFYFLPVMQRSGEVTVFPLNAIFRRGGYIRAMASWSVDGGFGMDDNLVLFSSNGECVIYRGTDPATVNAWSLIGNYSFDAPMSKHSVVKYGGDLYVLASSGLLPMTTLMRAETEQLGTLDKSVVSIFQRNAFSYRSSSGWQAFLNPSSGRIYCNLPLGAKNKYTQMVRHMPQALWSQWKDIPARSWAWLDPIVYFGDDDGNVFQLHPRYVNDDGNAIKVDLQTAWSTYGYAGVKQFKMVNTYLITDGDPEIYIDVKDDFDYTDPENQPQLPPSTTGALWNVAMWDPTQTSPGVWVPGDFWATGPIAKKFSNGVSGTGHRAGIRVTALLSNCSLALTGFDIVFEPGSFV